MHDAPLPGVLHGRLRSTRTPLPDAKLVLDGLACGRWGCSCNRAALRGSGLTHCPSHDDQTPSLNVSVKDGLVLVHCQSEHCSQEQVIGDLKRHGLWPETQVRVARFPRSACSKDPAELLNQPDGDAAFEQAVRDAEPEARLLVDQPGTITRREVRWVGRRLEHLDEPGRESFLRLLSHDLDTPVEELREAFADYLQARHGETVRIEL